MDRGTWWVIVHGVAESQTQLNTSTYEVLRTTCSSIISKLSSQQFHESALLSPLYKWDLARCSGLSQSLIAHYWLNQEQSWVWRWHQSTSLPTTTWTSSFDSSQNSLHFKVMLIQHVTNCQALSAACTKCFIFPSAALSLAELGPAAGRVPSGWWFSSGTPLWSLFQICLLPELHYLYFARCSFCFLPFSESHGAWT